MCIRDRLKRGNCCWRKGRVLHNTWLHILVNTSLLDFIITVINRPYVCLRQSSKFHHQPSHLQHYFSTCKSFHIIPVGILLIRTALGIYWYNSARDYSLKTRLASETIQSFIIMHKAYCHPPAEPAYRWFSGYVIAAMLADENKRFLISSFWSSTRNCTLQHCHLCP